MRMDRASWLSVDKLAVFKSGVRKSGLVQSVQCSGHQHHQVLAVPPSLLWMKTKMEQKRKERFESGYSIVATAGGHDVPSRATHLGIYSTSSAFTTTAISRADALKTDFSVGLYGPLTTQSWLSGQPGRQCCGGAHLCMRALSGE